MTLSVWSVQLGKSAEHLICECDYAKWVFYLLIVYYMCGLIWFGRKKQIAIQIKMFC